MSPTRKATLCRILLILVALAPIAFLVGKLATRRGISEEPLASYPRIQRSLVPGALVVKDRSLDRHSPMIEDPHQVQTGSH